MLCLHITFVHMLFYHLCSDCKCVPPQEQIAQNESFNTSLLVLLLNPVLRHVFIWIKLNWLMRFHKTLSCTSTRFVKCKIAKKCCLKKMQSCTVRHRESCFLLRDTLVASPNS